MDIDAAIDWLEIGIWELSLKYFCFFSLNSVNVLKLKAHIIFMAKLTTIALRHIYYV